MKRIFLFTMLGWLAHALMACGGPQATTDADLPRDATTDRAVPDAPPSADRVIEASIMGSDSIEVAAVDASNTDVPDTMGSDSIEVAAMDGSNADVPDNLGSDAVISPADARDAGANDASVADSGRDAGAHALNFDVPIDWQQLPASYSIARDVTG